MELRHVDETSFLAPVPTARTHRRSSQAGFTMMEVMLAGTILTIGSLGMLGLVVGSIATNNRNKIDSTQTMLSEAIVEHLNSTVLGSGSSTLADCAGQPFTIAGVTGGANLNAGGSAIDFTENIAADSTKTTYHMDYYVNTPCNVMGSLQAIYDVRWNVQLVGGSTSPTNTYLLTVSTRLKNRVGENMYFSPPVTLRAMSGN